SNPLYYNQLQQEPISASGLPYNAWAGSVGETQPPNNLGPNLDMLYACPDPAGAQLEGMPCTEFQANFDFGWTSAAPRSRHLGGVCAVFLDGHVTFLPDRIDDFAMANLISANDGKAIDLSQTR